MSDEQVSATITIAASAEAVFAVLADPATHAAIDGTGWVRDAVDAERLTSAGQVFRVGMYHEEHPDGSYEIANQVLECHPPRTISWKPGYVAPATDELEFGGWTWRYDLAELGPDETEVRLTYDWSAVGPAPREYLDFPPFAPDHLDNSLSNLAAIVGTHARSDRPSHRERNRNA